jgi:hypothetical protein
MYFALKVPPGVVRGGTPQESAGRFYDSDRVRWVDGHLQPIGGWRKRKADQTAMTGKGRAMLVWRDNTTTRWIAVGTHSHLYAQTQGGVLYDITPVGFTAGLADATIFTGYGAGPYGVGSYGTPRPDTGTSTPATVWSLDSWGESLVGCTEADGTLYEWSLDTGTPAAAISGAPTDCYGLVVTDERFLFALGAGGNPRKVQWSDQEDNTNWTPDATNQAGDLELKTPGVLMAGRSMRGRTLLLTSADAWQAVYEGAPYVYGIERVGDGCGLAAKGAVALTGDDRAVWMGRKGFWLFNGFVQPLDCPLLDFLLSDINPAQISKVAAVPIADQGEVFWFYPSSGATENDSYVAWNSRTGAWSMGLLGRTCGADATGILKYPLMVDPAGYIYEHEVGVASGAYAETGPLELGAGDRMMLVSKVIPDHITTGSVTASFYTRTYPNDTEATQGPYSLAVQTDALFQGREVRVRYTFTGDGRVGQPKLDLTPGDAV